MSCLLLKSDVGPHRDDHWQAALVAADSSLQVRRWPALGDPSDIEYALLWEPPPGLLPQLANLKLIFSIGAGVDHLMDVADRPRGLPVIRMVEPALTAGMSEYVLYQCLRFHRSMQEYDRMQRNREWVMLPQVPPAERRIGIMGLGVLGGDAARKLLALGFAVRGWTRRPRQLPGVKNYAGPEQLEAFLGDTDILVCLLPLSPETRGILNARTLAMLPPGACLVNPGRGPHLEEQALLAALDSGHLRAAALDVFNEEPLPAHHPYWSHPALTLTPHIASVTLPCSAALHVIENIRRYRAGEALLGVVDPAAGY